MSGRAIDIVAGYRPGVVGRCLELQALYYAKHFGFGRVFETGRAGDIAAFFHREPDARSQFWSAIGDGVVVGTVAIDGRSLDGDIAQVRWLVVDEAVQGAGIGRRLFATAMAFVDETGFAETHLWTFAGLDPARRLYEGAGFRLVAEAGTTEWGPAVLKQHFVRAARSRKAA